MALGRGLISVRGTRGKNCVKWTAGSPQKILRKKKIANIRMGLTREAITIGF
jgi:hypothetical protein